MESISPELMSDARRSHEEAEKSFNPKRKNRLRQYVKDRAASCFELASECNNSIWRSQDMKQQVILYKPVTEWNGFLSSKAVITANASFPLIPKILADLNSSINFKTFLRKILGEYLIDGQILEELEQEVDMSPESFDQDAAIVFEEQAAIKWWAVKSGPLANKPSDFYVLEYIGAEMDQDEIKSCYLYQESLAQVGDMPPTEARTLERAKINALICKFERLPIADFTQELVQISVVCQRRSPLVALFRSNTAAEMATQFANGLKDLLEDPIEAQEIAIMSSADWIKDKERSCCVICLRKYSAIFRRRHHCRTCGEVICSQCSSTIRVPGRIVKSTENLSTSNRTSIRLCIQCVGLYSQHKGIMSYSSQQALTDLVHRQRKEAISSYEEEKDDQEMWDQSSQNDKKATADDTEISQIVLLERASRNYVDAEDDILLQQSGEAESYESDEDLSTWLHSGKLSHTSNYTSDSAISEQLLLSMAMEDKKKRSFLYSSDADSMITIESGSASCSLSSKARRSKAYSIDGCKQTQVSTITQTKDSPLRRRTKSTMNEECHYARSQHGREASAFFSFQFSSKATGKTVHRLVQECTNVCTASAWSSHKDEKCALKEAYEKLLEKLDGTAHFLVVGFTTAFSADLLITFLREQAPDVPYIGGTIACGLCDENSWVSVNRQNDEGLLTLWGVNDPYGIYSVAHADYSQSDPKEKAYAAARAAYGRVENEIQSDETPSFIVAYACPLNVEDAIEGIREAICCPFVGGCSSDVAKQGDLRGHHISSTQISSSSSSDYTKNVHELRGDKTGLGIAFALCFPSVETRTSWFTGYQPFHGPENTYCSGTVTKASSRKIFEIDSKPAAQVYKEWIDIAVKCNQSGVSETKFPRLGNLYPLGTSLDLECGPDIESLHNMTAVISSLDEEEGSLNTTSSVTPGTSVTLMEMTEASLETSIRRLRQRVLESSGLGVDDIDGSLIFVSSGVHALLGHHKINKMVDAYRKEFPGAALMGMTTSGGIGHLVDGNDFPHFDSLMFGAVLFTRRRRTEYLFF